MLGRRLLSAIVRRPNPSLCLFCALRTAPAPAPRLQRRLFSASRPHADHASVTNVSSEEAESAQPPSALSTDDPAKQLLKAKRRKRKEAAKKRRHARLSLLSKASVPPRPRARGRAIGSPPSPGPEPLTLREALPGTLEEALQPAKTEKKTRKRKKPIDEDLNIEILSPDELRYEPIDIKIPPIPMLSHGLDRVLFNPGVYRLQDPRSRVYNFDPYLEKIMPVREFDFDALGEYRTSSKDEDLLAMTKRLGAKFTGSTSSMSTSLTHFHYLLSGWRRLTLDRLSKVFPHSNDNFSKIQRGPAAILLRWKDGTYAIDADKEYDTPNIMSWLGHSLEKLLTNPPDTFERYRRSSPEQPPKEEDSSKCFHYSQLGNFLIRSQLDAYDPRLPGTGVFDLKTRAVVSIRMNHQEYEVGSGYQLRYDQGEWESYEREFYDMTRATMLKYSLQVRMGRMDGIFVAYHNIERLFGFQYLSLEDMDYVLHGQTDPYLGDQEFKLSVRLLDEILQRATERFPETSIRMHFETREASVPFMYIVAEPVTEEQADAIQNVKSELYKRFERDTIGVNKNDPEMQAEWQNIQERVDEEVGEDGSSAKVDRDDREDHLEASPGTAQVRQPDVAEEGGGEDSPGRGDTSTSSSSETDTSNVENDAAKPPLIGWTLTIRHRVNGEIVPRPENLTATDDWKLEYHLQELAANNLGRINSSIKTRRKKLTGQGEEDVAARLTAFRDVIRNISKRGRQWREAQDKVDEQIGRRLYSPLGPGFEEEARQSVLQQREHAVDKPLVEGELVDESRLSPPGSL